MGHCTAGGNSVFLRWCSGYGAVMVGLGRGEATVVPASEGDGD